MTSMVGPRVLTDVIMRHDNEVQPILSKLRSMRTSRYQPPEGFQDTLDKKMPLGRYIQIGRLGSWK
ncbi:hypothetical protein D3C76_1636400 [compost metagenome]